MMDKFNHCWRKAIQSLFIGLLALVFFVGAASTLAAQTNYDFSYTGRLVDSVGKPYSGPVALKVSFFHVAADGTPVLTVTNGLESVTLQEGIFQIKLTLSAANYSLVFGDVAQPTYIEITDLTHAPTAPFPRQQVNMIPYAARIPVDNKTVGFNSDGQLSVKPFTQPAAGEFLTKDGSGNFVWASPPSATSIQGQTIDTATPSNGQVLTYDGSKWTPTSPAGVNGGTVTNVTGSGPISVTNNTTTPGISISQASGVGDGYLSCQ